MDLWIEKYRPKRINEYVFKNAQQKEQILKWIKEQSIPNLLLTGAPGTGKCLVGSEEVVVEIDTATLTDDQINDLKTYLI